MHTITLSGTEYFLRCDLNVIEQIEEEYGSLAVCYEKSGEIPVIKFLAAAMINEHFYYTGSPERVTVKRVGSMMNMTESIDVMREVLTVLSECVSPKNA